MEGYTPKISEDSPQKPVQDSPQKTLEAFPKKILQNKLALKLFFVFFGFFCAFLVFNFLTKSKQVVSPGAPIQDEVQISKTSSQKLDIPDVIISKEDNIAKPAPVVKETRPREIPTFILNGIFSSKGEKLALINNLIVKEGDLLLGARVLHIYSNKVELDTDGQKITLRLK